jgi:GntR family transcriptional repressor for pyruvate dehydrogenase complex
VTGRGAWRQSTLCKNNKGYLMAEAATGGRAKSTKRAAAVDLPDSAPAGVDAQAPAFAFDKLKRVPSYRMLAEAVTLQILDGRLREGDPLPTEAQLCETFGVNRSTVREAVRVLEEASLLRRESTRRFVISHPSNADIGVQFERMVQLQAISFQELWEAVRAMGPAMARLAAQRATAAQLDELEAQITRLQQAADARESLVELNLAFDDMVARMSGNRALLLAHETMWRQLYPRYQTLVFDHVPAAGKRMLEARRATLAAMRRRDADEAEQCTIRHIVDFKRGYELAERKLAEPPQDAAPAPVAAKRRAPQKKA